MHQPAVDLTYMLNAADLSGNFVLGTDLFIGPLRGIPRFVPGDDSNFKIPPCALFVDTGSAFNPDRFMGQTQEIRYARVMLHLRSLGYSDGRGLMISVMDFLLGKKFYVFPGDPDDPESRVVWHTLGAEDLPDPTPPLKDPNRILKRFIDGGGFYLEYLDVYTTSSEPIHSGPDLDSRHFFTSTYNMVYTQGAIIKSGESGLVTFSGIEGVGNSI